MSGYWTGYYGVGLVMEEKEFEGFAEQYKKIHEVEEEINTQYVSERRFIASDETKEDFFITKVSNDCCEGAYFIPYKGSDGKNNICFLEDNSRNPYYRDKRWITPSLYVVFTDKEMDGVDAFDEKPYASYDALLREFKEKLAKYLLEDFDWDGHIGRLQYACYA